MQPTIRPPNSKVEICCFSLSVSTREMVEVQLLHLKQMVEKWSLQKCGQYDAEEPDLYRAAPSASHAWALQFLQLMFIVPLWHGLWFTQ